ncbi:MAG: hypothetical protein RLZZ44_501 [Bacteroidota bacterium]|jgi:hypothetical protein
MLVIWQQLSIAQKIKQDPDSSYPIGLLIGTFIPFIILVGLAYWMYSRAKKRDQNP